MSHYKHLTPSEREKISSLRSKLFVKLYRKQYWTKQVNGFA